MNGVLRSPTKTHVHVQQKKKAKGNPFHHFREDVFVCAY